MAFIFIYLRVIPIYNQTVPYTYDQGRDFKAARTIVIDKDITLIGPTTGAQGVFHGAWWYYFLAIPFALTGGAPTAFYYFIVLSSALQGGLLYVVLRRVLNEYLALLAIAIVAISPYFIRMSVFAISSIMTMPFVLLLMYALYRLIAATSLKKQIIWSGVLGFAIGMVMEGEVAFGIFLIPSFVLALFLARELPLLFNSWKKVLAAAAGFVLATPLRILFELKNNFLQTRALLGFGDTPGTNDVSVQTAFFERIDLFKGYYGDLFPRELDGLGWILLIAAICGIYAGWSQFSKTQRRFFALMSLTVSFIFITSLAYNKNFFWTNYLEGIHYIFLVLIMFGLYGLILAKQKYSTILVLFSIGACIVFAGAHLYTSAINPEPVRVEGLRMQSMAIDHVHKKVGSEPFCLRMYTPPAITHTYDYLLDYHARTKGLSYPRTIYINDECWYIIESDKNKERLDVWLSSNIPEGTEKTYEYHLSKDVVIQKWKLSVK